VKTGMRQLNRR